MYRSIFLSLLACICMSVSAQNITGYEYWFDRDDGNRITTASAGGDIDIIADASGLNVGAHTITYRALDSNGRHSAPLTSYFIRCGLLSTDAHIADYEYWFDHDYAGRKSATSPGGDVDILVDALVLAKGAHTLTYRVKDSRGRWSAPQTSYFLRLTSLDVAPQLAECEYWMDHDFAGRVTTPCTDGLVSLDIDASALAKGAHTLTYRVKDSHGRWSAPQSSYFLRLTALDDAPLLAECEYWMDHGFAGRVTTPCTDGLVSIDIDASALAKGAHTLTYRVKDSHGRWSAPQTSYYVRPVYDYTRGDNRILGYKYWFNDAMAKAKYISVDPTDSLALDTWIDATGLDTRITPDNLAMVITDSVSGKARIGVKNRVYTTFKDANRHWSPVRCDTFTVVASGSQIDFTAFIVNPNASLGDKGWEKSGTISQFVQRGDRVGDPDNPYFYLGNPSSGSFESQMRQSVTGLPAGTYTLHATVRASANASLNVSAAGVDKDFASMDKENANGGWNNLAVAFTTDGSTFDIIIHATSTESGQWVEIDDIMLTMESTATLTVNFPDDIDVSLYANCMLQLISASKTSTMTVSGKNRSYTFRNINGCYDLKLINAYKQTLSHVKDIQIATDDNFVTLEGINPLSSAIVKVVADNRDVTDMCTVRWFEPDGRFMAEGCTIKGVAVDQDVYYTVSLSDSLANSYKIPASAKYVPASGRNNIEVTLSTRDKYTVVGRIINEDGKPLIGVAVSLTQSINGKPFTQLVRTDSIGEYAFEAELAEATIRASHVDYVDVALLLNIRESRIDDILMQRYDGTTVTLDINYQGQDDKDKLDYSDLEFVIRKATGEQIYDYSLQGVKLKFTDRLEPGTALDCTIKSKGEKFKEIDTTVTLTENTVMTATIIPYGSLHSTYEYSINPQTVMLLYDDTGVLVRKIGYDLGHHAYAMSLPDGDYTVIAMAESRAMSNILSLAKMAEVGLKENVDYLKLKVGIGAGVVSYADFSEIPYLVESKFYYTDERTDFSVNKSNVVIGDFVTYNTKIVFKPSYTADIDNLVLNIDLPKGCQYVEGSAILGGEILECNTDVPERLSFAIDKDRIGDRLRFCVVALQPGNYSPNAIIQYTLGSETITQPLGSAKFTAERMGILVPEVILTPEVQASGITLPYSQVRVYDKNVCIGQTSAKANGRWALSANIDNPLPFTTHYIRAEVSTPGGYVLNTETKNVEYNDMMSRVKSVTMIHTAHPDAAIVPTEYTTVFDFENPEFGTRVYNYWPSYPSFTFICKFVGETNKQSNVQIVVYTSDGGEKWLQASYDANSDAWIAKEDFHSGNLPINVGVSYQNNLNNLTPTLSRSLVMAAANADYSYSDFEGEGVMDEHGQYHTMLYVGDEAFDMKPTVNAVRIENLDFELDSFDFDYDGATYTIYSYTDWDNWKLGYILPKAIINQSSSYLQQEDNTAMAMAIADVLDSPYEYVEFTISIDTESMSYFKAISRSDNFGINDLNDLINAIKKVAKKVDGHVNTVQNYWLRLQWILENCDCDIIPCGLAMDLQDRLTNLILRYIGVSSFTEGVQFIGSKLANFGGIPGKIVGEGVKLSGKWLEFAADYGMWASLASINNNIKSMENACGKRPDDPTPPKPYPGGPLTPKMDPSGYVYEAVSSNRLPDVIATIYEKVSEENMYGDLIEKVVKWDAEEYGEINPVLTDADGLYAWDVPQGWWQVKFEKAGYETALTDWLPVPPPQLDVNMPMYQAIAPEVTAAKGYESGVIVEFSKYMIPDSFADRVSVTRNGSDEPGRVEMLNLEQSPTDDLAYVSRIKFVSDRSFETSDVVCINVSQEVESYAHTPMDADYSAIVAIEREVTSLVADSVLTIANGAEADIHISAEPARAAAGKKVNVLVSSPSIATCSESTVTLDSNGEAIINVTAVLPGLCVLTYVIDGCDLMAQTTINVEQIEDRTAKPKASIPSGTVVPKGTEVTLTCATVGARIYYTLDGTCPCNEATRILYVQPIVITEDVTIKAIAVCDSLEDSEMAVYEYSIDGGDGIVDVDADTVKVYIDKGAVHISGAVGMSLYVYTIDGKLYNTYGSLQPETNVRLSAGSYLLIVIDDNRLVFNQKAIIQ